jgi:hypothetical protein
MESLVESGILRIFQERGIEIYQIHSRVMRSDQYRNRAL